MKTDEFVSIVGSNGSGKSTLVKLFNGLLTGYQGEVRIFDYNPASEKEIISVRRNLGMVFQNPENQIVCSIVEDDVAFSLENLGIPGIEIRQRVDEALQITGLCHKKRSQTSDLSGGQMQRLAIASIIAMKPAMIIFDEATSMLDQRSRKEIFELICSLNRQEKTGIIYITHFMEEALAADRVIIMNDGKIEASGKPVDVFNQIDLLKKCRLNLPEPKYLARFLSDKGILFNWKNILDENGFLFEVENLIKMKKGEM